MIFNELYKKRGFYETMYTLYNAKNYSLVLPEFFERLEESNSYYNAFFRVKDEMLKYDIITYKKNRNNEKVIGLTKKGVEITRVLKKIDMLIDLPYDEYKEKMKKLKKQQQSRAKRLAARKA